jgi:hypothetical protein
MSFDDFTKKGFTSKCYSKQSALCESGNEKMRFAPSEEDMGGSQRKGFVLGIYLERDYVS